MDLGNYVTTVPCNEQPTEPTGDVGRVIRVNRRRIPGRALESEFYGKRPLGLSRPQWSSHVLESRRVLEKKKKKQRSKNCVKKKLESFVH
jgi:hypothetical protein